MFYTLKVKSNVFNILLILLSVLALIFYIVFVDGIHNVLEVFLKCNPWWVFIGFFVFLLYLGLETHILDISLKIFGKKLNPLISMKNCILGQFFNNITPSATGGQPFQVFYMSKHGGVGYGVAVGALLVKFVCFQISLSVICIFVLLLKLNYFLNKIQGFAIFMFLGFFINIIIALALVLVGLNKKVTLFLLSFFAKMLSKFKIFKELENKLKGAKKEIDFFNRSIVLALKRKKEIFKMLFLSVVQLLVFYFINVVVAFVCGIRLNFEFVFNIMCGAACVQMSSTFIPLPGAVGGAEFLYCAVYEGVFAPEKMSTALLLWRIYSFYFPIILGLLIFKGFFGDKDKVRIN